MATKSWFVHIGGESFGPLSTDVVTVMLRQTRLHFTDFIWQKGLTKWVRISDVDAFASLLPSYPNLPIPENDEAIDSRPEKKIPLPVHRDVHKAVRSGQIEPAQKEVKTEKHPAKLSTFPRVKLDGKIRSRDGELFTILDISEGGVFVAAKEPKDIGTEIEFTLEAHGIEKLTMRGVVIRHSDRDQQSGFAIEFMRVNPGYKRIIQNYINEELHKK